MARKILMEYITELPLCSSAIIAAWFEGRLFLRKAGITLVKTAYDLLKTLDNYHVYPSLGKMEPYHYSCVWQEFR